MKRRLEAAGFVESSQKGSHVKFVRSSDASVDIAIVPRKREISVGRLRSILNQAHIAPDDWEELVRIGSDMGYIETLSSTTP